MVQSVQKELNTLNVNVYSSRSGERWSKVERMLHYNGKPYIPETLRADLLERNHDIPASWAFWSPEAS